MLFTSAQKGGGGREGAFTSKRCSIAHGFKDNMCTSLITILCETNRQTILLSDQREVQGGVFMHGWAVC